MSGETRKLQKVGGGTYTVSIPKEWATEQSLSAGETVHLYPDGDGSLVVCGDGDADEAATATISIDGGDGAPADDSAHHVLDPVHAAYAAGLERVTLTGTGALIDADRRHLVRSVRERTGTRIAAECDDSVTIETILDDAEVSVPRTVVQLQFVTLSLFRTAIDLALDPSANGADRIEDRRDETRRLRSLVTRQFGRSLSRPSTAVELGVDRATAFDCYRTARTLDRFATLSTELATASDGVDDGAVTDGLRSIADAVRLHVEGATTAVVDGATVESARELRETREEIAGLVTDVEGSVDGDTRRVLSVLEGCADAGDRIADVALEAAIRRDG